MNNFYFTKKERHGMVFILIVMCASLILLSVQRKIERPKSFDFGEINATKMEVLISDEKIVAVNKQASKKNIKKTNVPKKNITKQTIQLSFNFDPNKISRDSLMLLGISKKTANTLIKYRSKGGTFKKPLDLMKIYGMEDEFDLVKDLIQIEIGLTSEKPKIIREFPDSNYYKKIIEKETIYEIEINITDSFELQLIKGIGPSYASRIINYRSSLGGFASLQQLYEVWGIKSEDMDGFIKNLSLSTQGISKLKINSISSNELSKHPYINSKKSGIVVRYRENHGPFLTKKDLLKVKVLSEVEIDKLEPYLEFTTSGN